MKKVLFYLIVFLLPILFFSCGIIRNHNPFVREQLINYSSIDPEFSGGLDSLKSYIERNLIYPKKAIDSNIQGKVYASFVIDTSGSISDIKILRGLSKECDEEAIRIIKSMPKWKPGYLWSSNTPDRVAYTLPILFKLPERLKSQDTVENNNIFIPCESGPSFSGGDAALFDFIKNNLSYPRLALENKVEGKVYLRFYVEVDGSITDIKVMRGIGYGCDEEAVRIVKLMPNWIPYEQFCGKDKGVKRQLLTMPILFKPTEKDLLFDSDTTIYTVVDMQASFVGGKDSLDVFLAQNIKYINECDVRGKIVASFIVEKDGSISNIKLIRDIGCGLGEEYLRVLRLMPKWKPAEKNGKIVRQEIIYPMVIKLL
ncbi:MAG: TonB family protein [Bacteroidetes bacterium]|nr:TonB family protein [Bacteroidota bacterium]